MLPFTPISEALLDRTWMLTDWEVLKSALTAVPKMTDEWRAYVISAQAIVDREAAWKLALFLNDESFKAGNCRSCTYYWIATRPDA